MFIICLKGTKALTVPHAGTNVEQQALSLVGLQNGPESLKSSLAAS